MSIRPRDEGDLIIGAVVLAIIMLFFWGCR